MQIYYAAPHTREMGEQKCRGPGRCALGPESNIQTEKPQIREAQRLQDVYTPRHSGKNCFIEFSTSPFFEKKVSLFKGISLHISTIQLNHRVPGRIL